MEAVVRVFGPETELAEFEQSLSKSGLQTYQPFHQGQDLDPATAQLIVVGVQALVGITTAVLSYLTAGKQRTIRIRGVDGWEVVLPADTPAQEIEQHLRVASARGANLIHLTPESREKA